MANVKTTKKLTRKQKEELAALLEEKARRQREEKLRYYNTGTRVHHKQVRFHQDTRRNRWVLGGNRTGKTVAGAVEAVWRARGIHPYRKITRPTKGWVVSLDYNVQRDVAQKEVLRWLNPAWIKDIHVRAGKKDDPENAIIDFIVVESVHGGESIIGFKSCDQGRSKFQGTSLDWVWFDEEPPKEIYDECKMRIIDTRGDIWGTMTPLQGLTWVYESIYMNEPKDPEVICYQMEWADNPWLSPAEISALESTMTDDEREARQYGRFIAMSGLVYSEFRDDVHVIDPIPIPREWYNNISIDPGLAAPLSCHFYAVDYDNNIYVVAEHYQAGQTVEYHSQKIHQIAAELGWPVHDGYLYALMDPAANQRTLAAEKSVTELFADHRIIADTNINKDKWTGIQRVKQYLKLRPNEQVDIWPRGKPKLFIFRNCPMLIKEIKGYRWKPDSDEPIKANDHAMDELRYFCMSRPEIGEGESFLPGGYAQHAPSRRTFEQWAGEDDDDDTRPGDRGFFAM
jgi:phage terminase large subunit-like protein